MDRTHFDFTNKWGEEIRNRYRLKSQQHVNGKPLEAKLVKTRTMNFGQHWRTEGIIDYPYEIRLPFSYVVDFVNSLLPEYNEDAQNDPEVDNELDRLLAGHNWSEDAEFLLTNTTNRIQYLLIEYFVYEMLLHWYTDSPVGEDGCVINTYDTLAIADGYVFVNGLCRNSGIPVVYQDV